MMFRGAEDSKKQWVNICHSGRAIAKVLPQLHHADLMVTAGDQAGQNSARHL
jgi:hypothetical protein